MKMARLAVEIDYVSALHFYITSMRGLRLARARPTVVKAGEKAGSVQL
jgi:hypothetical protein